MNCATITFIEEYLRDETAPSVRSEFERHLAVCLRCRQGVERERSFEAMLRGQSLLLAPATLRARVMEGLDAPKLSFSFSDRIWIIGLGLVLAAIGAIIGFAGREVVSGLSSRISQLLAAEKVFEAARRYLPIAGTDWQENILTTGKRNSTESSQRQSTRYHDPFGFGRSGKENCRSLLVL